jgi:two-component system autoinducer 1 sensor kinase/phosphatase LuxN
LKADLERGLLTAKSVIIADDMADAWAVAAILLGELGMTVYEAENGLETLSLCKEHAVDLILLDVRMPKLSGKELIAQIKTLHKSVPILAITGDKSSVVDGAENLLLDINAYLIKPYQPRQLVSLIASLIA